MSEQRLSDYLGHIAQAARETCDFVEGMTRADFMLDRRTQQAVTMGLVVIGEAATQVMDRHPGFVAQHPEVPWRNIRGMRNRIAHGYFAIDLDLVWDTVATALPELIGRLARLDQL